MIGNKKIIEDLKKISASGTLSHGYIFYGPSMVGKKTIALAFAHFLENGNFEVPMPAEILQDAKLIQKGESNSIGIDAVREIKDFLWQRPNVSIRRTLIIDDADLLTTEAQNALLKVTEEPPASSLLILITSDIESIMGTIQSRLPKIYFGTSKEGEIAEWLMSVGTLKKAEATAFAKSALGKPGLAARLVSDKKFLETIESAKKFLKTTPATRKEFLKKLLEPEDFNLRIFLDAVIISLAAEPGTMKKPALWHKTLALYQNVNNFGLNPRLQLENLLTQ